MAAMTRTSIIELLLRGEWELPRSPLHNRFAFDFQPLSVAVHGQNDYER